jgi:hypothetical protein
VRHNCVSRSFDAFEIYPCRGLFQFLRRPARVLAAIGFCSLTAMSGRPETASFVTERNWEPGVGRAGTVSICAAHVGETPRR